MEKEDIKLLLDWFEEHKDDKLNFLAKEAIKFEVKKANTVGDLLKTALDLLKKQGYNPIHPQKILKHLVPGAEAGCFLCMKGVPSWLKEQS